MKTKMRIFFDLTKANTFYAKMKGQGRSPIFAEDHTGFKIYYKVF